MYHANVNVNSIVENVTRIKTGIRINVSVGVKRKKSIVFAKKIKFGILLHVVVKVVNM